MKKLPHDPQSQVRRFTWDVRLRVTDFQGSNSLRSLVVPAHIAVLGFSKWGLANTDRNSTMFVRCKATRNRTRIAVQIVESRHVGGKVRQTALDTSAPWTPAMRKPSSA